MRPLPLAGVKEAGRAVPVLTRGSRLNFLDEQIYTNLEERKKFLESGISIIYRYEWSLEP